MSNQFTDAQTVGATVASTTETSLGEIQVPAGRSYRITDIWCGGPGGTYRVAVNTIPSMQGERVQNSTDPTNIGATNQYATNIMASGPSTITIFVSNAAATSTACKATVSYVDSGA
jgi:hypothetical protein